MGRYCCCYSSDATLPLSVVTASVDAMHFLAPIRLGWVVTLKASVNFTSRTSCEVGVKVTAENPLNGERFHTATAYLTMVGVDNQVSQ